ncbi:PIN domain-containing protein [uncultured Treponema sp.]|uniref:PIN domain-containing protein n=1 Tax=uncultured Treponema sp. TaxID=162155 RepID=UPI0025D1B961|nr:PIN domain-containing protein [uncultured Treponema sp.]
MNYTDTKVFLDTNILAYIFDSRDIAKKAKAKELFSQLVIENNCMISTQVLQELFNVVTKKLKYSKEDAQKIIMSLMNLVIHQVSTLDIQVAMKISSESQFTIYDSLIIAAAKAESCKIVYSEDLNAGQVVEGVKIVNPF